MWAAAYIRGGCRRRNYCNYNTPEHGWIEKIYGLVISLIPIALTVCLCNSKLVSQNWFNPIDKTSNLVRRYSLWKLKQNTDFAILIKISKLELGIRTTVNVILVLTNTHDTLFMVYGQL